MLAARMVISVVIRLLGRCVKIILHDVEINSKPLLIKTKKSKRFVKNHVQFQKKLKLKIAIKFENIPDLKNENMLMNLR